VVTSMHRNKQLLLALLAALTGAFFLLDLHSQINFDTLKASQALLADYNGQHPYKTAGGFFLLFVVLTGMSLPVAGILIMASGVIFGLLWGTIIASFASTFGATLAFLCSRYLFRDIVVHKFETKLARINQGIEADGIFYLFLLRQIPLFPAFMINILMGVTSIRASHFYLTTQLGMLPFTIVFVNAGTQIASINGPADVLSPRLLISLLLAGIFPLLAKLLVRRLKKFRGRVPENKSDDRLTR